MQNINVECNFLLKYGKNIDKLYIIWYNLNMSDFSHSLKIKECIKLLNLKKLKGESIMKKFRMVTVVLILAILSVVSGFKVGAASWKEGGGYKYLELENGSIRLEQFLDEASSVNVPEEIDGKKVTEISPDCFRLHFEVKKINLPKYFSLCGSVQIFAAMVSLENISVAQDNPYFSSNKGILYSKDGTILIVCPSNYPNEKFVCPASVTEVAKEAFATTKCRAISFEGPLKKAGINAWASMENISYFQYPILEEDTNPVLQDSGQGQGEPKVINVLISKEINYINPRAFMGSKVKLYVASDSYGLNWAKENQKDYVISDSKITDPTSQIEVESVPEDSTLKVLNDGNQFEISFSSAFAEELGNVKLSIPMPERALVWKGTEPVGSQYDGKNVIITEKADEISGQYSFTTPIWGDVLEDGLNLKDAAYIQGSVSEKTDLTTKQNLVGDFNGDGKITMKDVSDIQIATLGD